MVCKFNLDNNKTAPSLILILVTIVSKSKIYLEFLRLNFINSIASPTAIENKIRVIWDTIYIHTVFKLEKTQLKPIKIKLNFPKHFLTQASLKISLINMYSFTIKAI